MFDEMLEITNKREIVNIIGKEIKKAELEEYSQSLLLTFSDDSTFKIKANLCDLRVLFLNKQGD